jgi:acylphosphatase
MKKQVILKIYGKVQGVFFRDSSRIKARELNLSGFVQNESDGTVLIVVEGDDRDLRRMIDWCKNGPDNADVEKVGIKWGEAQGKFNDFTES